MVKRRLTDLFAGLQEAHDQEREARFNLESLERLYGQGGHENVRAQVEIAEKNLREVQIRIAEIEKVLDTAD